MEIVPKRPISRIVFEFFSVIEFMGGLIATFVQNENNRDSKGPILVIPGFCTGDSSTLVMRNYLQLKGFSVYGWGLGINLGPTNDIEEQLAILLKKIANKHPDEKITIIGWSMGGIFAREISKCYPELVKYVVTLGAPFADLNSASVIKIYEFVSGKEVKDFSNEFIERLKETPPLPSTSIYSEVDPIISPNSCIQPEGEQCENIKVISSHFGLIVNPSVLALVSERILQKKWKKYNKQKKLSFNSIKELLREKQKDTPKLAYKNK